MKPKQANVILFFTDQQRWDTLGLNDCRLGLTPNLDRLARQGTFFRQAVSPQPVCGPARSCIQTGQYASTTGVWRNGLGLRDDSPRMSREFKAAGYRTAYIGKWHLSKDTGPGCVPAANREYYDHWLGANALEMVSGPYSTRLWDSDNKPVDLPGYRSDAVVDAGVRYLSETAASATEPFFLTLSFIEPHHQNTDDSYPPPKGMETTYLGSPLPPDLQSLGGSAAAHWPGYCAMVRRLDDGLGRLTDALETLGLAENTIVAFISDHGCHFKTRNCEYKRSPHEASLRVPFAIWGPGWNGGGQHDAPASLVDLAPSLLESVGLAAPEAMQGRSLFPLTMGSECGCEESFFQIGDLSLPPGRGLRTKRWKYAVTAPDASIGCPHAETYRETHLYDLQADPYELSNLIECSVHEPIREAFRVRLKERCAAIGEAPFDILPPSDGQMFQGQRRIDYPNTGSDRSR